MDKGGVQGGRCLFSFSVSFFWLFTHTDFQYVVWICGSGTSDEEPTVPLGTEVHIQLQLSAYRVTYGPGAQVIDICTGFESTPVIISKVTDNIQDDQLHALSSLFDHCQLL